MKGRFARLNANDFPAPSAKAGLRAAHNTIREALEMKSGDGFGLF
jgi:hypothetical protein